MFFNPASQVVGMTNVEFVCLKTLKYINVIHEYTFTGLWLTSDLP